MTAPAYKLMQRMKESGGTLNDERWIKEAFGHLGIANVRQASAERMCHEVIEQVAHSGKPASILRGTPEDWAQTAINDAVSRRANIFEDLPGNTWQTVAQTCLIAGIFYTMVFGLGLYDPDSYVSFTSLPALLIPLYVAVMTQLAGLLYLKTLRVASYPVAALSGVSTVLTGLVMPIATFLAFNESFTSLIGGDGTNLYLWLACALVSFAAAILSLRRYRSAPAAQKPLPDTDEQWVNDFRGYISYHHKLSWGGINTHLAEVRSYVQEAGGSIADNFGSALTYARLLEADPAVKPLRQTWLYFLAGIVLLVFLVAAGEYKVFHILTTLFVFAQILLNYREYRKAIQGRREEKNA